VVNTYISRNEFEEQPGAPYGKGIEGMVTTYKAKAPPRRNTLKAATAETAFRGFRRLSWDEVVCHGDYVADEQSGLKLWEGLSGFRASSFVQPIYRKTTIPAMEPSLNKSSKRTVKTTL
jgi:hypothetical protein